MKRQRNERGAALGLVAALTVVLVILGMAFFKLTIFFGAADETRNSTDAGALNAGKHSFDLNVTASSSDERQFEDVADANKQFNLTNINRVWAKAMLANANVAAMALSNQSTPQAIIHAEQLYRGANSISNKLADELKNPENFYKNFEEITSGNNVRLAASENSQVAAVKDKDWKTAYVDRGEDSNISFDPNQLPLPLQFASPANTKTFKVPGYTQIPILDKKFYLVSMKDNERTHLINPESFEANTEAAKPLDGWKNPVPNAFSVHGATSGVQGLSNKALSWVQVNPQYKFNLGIPHAFIRIHLDNSAVYSHLGERLGSESYAFRPGVSAQSFTTAAQLKVNFVPVNIGNEYAGATSLYDALFPKALNATNEHTKVLNTLLQRCREIQKDFSLDQLVAVLKATPVDFTGTQSDYIIFPKKNVLVARLAAQAYSEVNWILPTQKADGGQKEIAREDVVGQPNTAMFTVTEPVLGTTIGPLPVVSQEHGSFKWTPGSGFDGCLGEMNVSRTTSLPAFGVPEPPKETK